MKRRVVVKIVVAVAAFAIVGCSKGNGGAPTITSSGKHPSGWAVAGTGGLHPTSYLAAPRQCLQCHGNDLKGGISGVSCFSSSVGSIQCHPQGPTAHPSGFASSASHGPQAKAAVGGINGFAMCQNCHGANFAGATTPSGAVSASCVACHGVNAPHPRKPWRGSPTHANVDQTNAPVCAGCHTRGANLSTPILSVYATGTPGCFNGTLCHAAVDHSGDPRQPWVNADNHGSAAKGNPAAGDGMELCKACHGQGLRGVGAASDCFACHQTAPHSPPPWRRTISTPSARTHVDTDPQNAYACAGCHQGNQRLTVPVAVTGNPGCFDNSLCHGATGHRDTTQFPVPAQPWNKPVNHGAKAKSTSSGNSGFNYCRNCHGTGSSSDPLFHGGRALTSCMNTLGCHGLLNNAPHPSAPWRGATVAGSTGHTTTDTSNDAICAICHTNGANSSRVPSGQDVPGTTGCFNASMCHGITGHADTSVYPAPWGSPANHGAFARTDPSAGATKGFSYCSHCHGSDFAGGSARQSCSPCHGVSAPHPAKADWTLAAGTLSHVNTGEGNAPLCVGCHNSSTKNLSTAPVNYVARFAPAGSFSVVGLPGCYNGSLCHADVRKTTNCNACHGPLNSTTFNSLAGVTSTSDAKVGTHMSHLNAAGQTTQLSVNVSCAECHTVPAAPGIAGAHRNGAVDVTFGSLATTGNLTITVTRDAGTGALVCSNTYCHGATLTGGSNKVPRWNDTGYLAGCGTCHGFPPNTGVHAGKVAADCHTCHPHVNNTGTGFIDPSKHVDGTVQATAAHAFPFSGASHKAATNGTGCIGCHSMGTGASSYPVTRGTPPECRGCHLTANPTSDPHCSDCHGSAANDANTVRGQPDGTSFPNTNGSHGSHSGLTCTTCHTKTTGSHTHGWYSSVRSTSAVIKPEIGWNPGTRQPGQGTCANPPASGGGGCHGSRSGWFPLP